MVETTIRNGKQDVKPFISPNPRSTPFLPLFRNPHVDSRTVRDVGMSETLASFVCPVFRRIIILGLGFSNRTHATRFVFDFLSFRLSHPVERLMFCATAIRIGNASDAEKKKRFLSSSFHFSLPWYNPCMLPFIFVLSLISPVFMESRTNA